MLVADRYVASSIAYGEAQGLDPAWLTEIQRFLPPATLTILLDIAPETAIERKAVDRDRYERDLAMQGRVRASYHRQADATGWIVIDGERSKDAIAADVVSAVAVTTRAAVIARTSAAPASFKARAHASSVAPVVHTSSTNTTTWPSQRLRRARGHEGVAHVLVASGGRKARLRGGRPRSAERAERPGDAAVGRDRRPD